MKLDKHYKSIESFDSHSKSLNELLSLICNNDRDRQKFVFVRLDFSSPRVENRVIAVDEQHLQTAPGLELSILYNTGRMCALHHCLDSPCQHQWFSCKRRNICHEED